MLRTIHWIDFIVILAYFALTLYIGFGFTNRNRSTDRYFLGGRSFPAWALGLSFIGGTISSVTFTAYPADSFKTSWVRLLPNLAFPLVALISAWLFVPFFRNGRVNSAYHYLELRFGSVVRVYAAIVYLIAQVMRMATITYLLAVLISNLVGIDLVFCVVLVAGLTGLYASKGGFEAVLWTEVAQTIVLMLGAISCVLVVLYTVPGGITEVWSHAINAGKISFRDLNPISGRLEPLSPGFSLSEKTAAMLMLVGAAQYIAGQLDQDTVQRWCAAKSIKDARRSMWVLGIGALPIWTMFMFLGTCLWGYYHHLPDDVSIAVMAGKQKAEDIFPHFVLTALPHGLAGLVISAALAAGMSSLGCCLSAASMVWVNDLYRKHIVLNVDDSHYLKVSKLTATVLSLLMMIGALFFHLVESKTLMDTSIMVTSMLGAGIAGAFVFGIFTNLGDYRAVLVGMLATLVFTAYAMLMQFKIFPRLFEPYYTGLLANIVMFTACVVAAKFIPSVPRDLTKLTIWNQSSHT